MGRRGTRPLPTAIKAARGTLRKCRTNSEEPQLAAPNSLEPPADLKGKGRDEWKRLIKDLTDKGVLRDADMSTFEGYCRTLTLLEMIEKQIRRVGLAGALATGLLSNRIKLQTQTKQLAAELGLTPSSRSGVKAVEKKAPGKLEQFLRVVK